MIDIEICKSYQCQKWRLRIGNIEGAIELSNISMREVLQEIKEEMQKELQEETQVEKWEWL